LGFQTVYEMMGGMMKWRAANLPETTNNQVRKPGMSLAEYTKLIHTDKIVLVDFYAEWCLPCKKMKPYLEEIAKELTPNVEVIRINADEHSALMKELKVEALPVLKVYKNGKETWNNVGFIPKEDVLKQLK
jgi:thioredoxin